MQLKKLHGRNWVGEERASELAAGSSWSPGRKLQLIRACNGIEGAFSVRILSVGAAVVNDLQRILVKRAIISRFRWNVCLQI